MKKSPEDALGVPTVSEVHPTETVDSGSAETPHPRLVLRRGASLGRYLILDELGRGGMGVVYAAYDPELDRKIAVKLLRDTVAERPGYPSRLRREARVLARLRHPNVLGVYDVGEFEGRVFLAMELVPGHTLWHWLKAEERSFSEILDVFLDAGQGLEAAHQAGIVHRDFKPSNVMVEGDGRVVVVDFGVAEVAARDAEADRTNPTTIAERAGTPAYMAPEQHDGQVADQRSDQFSFCVALFEALSGQRPPSTRLDEIRPDEIPGELVSATPRAEVSRVLNVLRRGLSREPADRFESMGELLGALTPPSGRRSSAVWWTAALVLVLAVAALPVYRWSEARRQLCHGGPARLTEIWDEGASSRLAEVFSTAEAGPIHGVWPGVRSLLDAYRTGWLEMYEDACQATHFRGEQSDELLDLRMGCLDQRRQELRTTVEVLARSDAEQLEDAVDLVAGLTPITGCADTVALTSPMSVPGDDQSRRLVASLRADLAAAKILHESGDLEPAEEIVDSALQEAEAMAYWPLVAEAAFRRGRLLETLDPGSSPPVLRQALEAAEAGRHDEIAVRTFIRLARDAGGRGSDAPQALRYASQAEALLSQLGDRPELEASIAEEVGSIHFQQGQWQRALEGYQRALTLGTRALGPQHPAVARTLTRLGNAHREIGDLKRAQEAYEQSLEIAEAAYGTTHPDVAAALNRLGSVAFARGDLEAAREPLERAYEIRVELLGDQHPRVASSLITLGNLATARGDAEEGYEHHRRAFELLKELLGDDHPNLAIPLSGMANARIESQRYDDAMVALDQALVLQRGAFGDDHPRIAVTLFNQGIVANKQERFGLGLERFEDALAIWRRLDDAPPAHIAATLTGAGHALIETGRADEAITHLEEALAMLESRDTELGQIARSRYRLAAALAAAGEHDRAVELGRRAVDELGRASSRFRSLHEEAADWLTDLEGGAGSRRVNPAR